MSPPPKLASSCHASEVGIPLCMGNCHTRDRCTSPTPHKTTSLGGEEMMPQEQNGKAVTGRPTRKASQGWKYGKLVAWIMERLPEHPLRMGEDHR